MNEVNGTVAQVMTAKDPQALFTMTQDGSLDQYAGKLFAHQQAVTKVVREAGEEITQMAEVGIEQIKVSLKDWMDSLAANAPAGSDAIVSAMKTSLESTLQGVGQIQAAAKEVASKVKLLLLRKLLRQKHHVLQHVSNLLSMCNPSREI